MQANSCLHSETRKCNLINLAHNTSCTLVACFISQIFQLHPNLLTRHTATHHNNIYNVFKTYLKRIYNVFTTFHNISQHFTTFHSISQQDIRSGYMADAGSVAVCYYCV